MRLFLWLALLGCSLLFIANGDVWDCALRDIGNTNYSPFANSSEEASKAWRNSIPLRAFFSQSVSVPSLATDIKGNLIVSGYQQLWNSKLVNFMSLYNSTGSLIWNYNSTQYPGYEVGYPLYPLVSRTNIFITISVLNTATNSTDSYIDSYSQSNGERQWSVKTAFSESISSIVLWDQSQLILAVSGCSNKPAECNVGNNGVYGLDQITGSDDFFLPVPAFSWESTSLIDSTNQTMYIIGNPISGLSNKTLYVLNLQTQSISWTFSWVAKSPTSMAVTPGGDVILLLDGSNLVKVVQPGNQVWSIDVVKKLQCSGVSGIAIDQERNNNIYFTCPSNLFSINLDGSVNWDVKVGSGDLVPISPSIRKTDGMIFVEGAGQIVGVDITGTQKFNWDFQSTDLEVLQTPVLVGNNITYVMTSETQYVANIYGVPLSI
eukprot:TRINITY_DN4478_c0_g1_i1.p1 TRINITY_DN4478_c0_g1~~TRINITY_DN4478_c0_g1_i1.p1  ORF type:complete len:433 (+),score=60.71 TRINITY_DN4478_c0_g1_i1:62-1360(+)